MGDGSLSQDEIDALLQGADDMLSSTSAPQAEPVRTVGGGGGLSVNEQNAIKESLNNAVRASVQPMSPYVANKNLSITNPQIEVKSPDAIRADFPAQYIQIAIDYSGGLSGHNLIVFNQRDAGIIAMLMLGGDSSAPPVEMDDAQKSTIQEFTGQLLANIAGQFSNTMGVGINPTTPIVTDAKKGAGLQLPAGNMLVKVTYDFAIPGVVTTKMFHIMDLGLASGIAGTMAVASQPAGGVAPTFHQPAAQVGINPVKFPPMSEMIGQGAPPNISLILDVPMTLTVELGRTTQLVQDILGLGEGSIIELDKLAGEPVDLLVNGKLIAKGEVVVIDENFGVRVTDIVSPQDRLPGLQ